MDQVSSWGRLTANPHHVVSLQDRARFSEVFSKELPGLAYGAGRSYGDVCLNANGTLWKTHLLDRLIDFNPDTGLLVCEPGVLLKTIQEIFSARGWMLPVTPGTQWATVGGAVANDVHGKNHHQKGSFGHHVRRIDLMRTNGERIVCGPSVKKDWFSATIGGMGLTGIITEVELQLMSVHGPWLEMAVEPYYSLEEFFYLSDRFEHDAAYTVAWIDCAFRGKHRGVLMHANPSACSDKKIEHKKDKVFPFTPPFSLVNAWSLKMFNMLYFEANRRKKGKNLVHYVPFFYPLDHVAMWNRLYGPRGFYQYQCVVPKEDRQEVINELLNLIKKHKEGSFLAVLKTFGAIESLGMMSFPREGVTLALDFANRGERTLKLFEALDSVVEQAKGRIYCAKNAIMSPSLFRQGYPQWEAFLAYRDPGISSELSRRLMTF